MAKDAINPAHYTAGGIETIDFIQAKFTKEELIGMLKGNVIKYLSRATLKNKKKELEDYKKALWYLTKLVEVMKGK
jgi:hypothetical protein